MITVERHDRRYRAELSETEDGIAVTIWERSRKDGGQPLYKRLHRDVLACAMHVAVDRVGALLEALEPPALADRRRRR